MQFPDDDFIIPNIATKNLFAYVNNIMTVKILLHHSHVAGKIHGYAHKFCNWKVREDRDKFLRA